MKNLLLTGGGVDSTALMYYLKENNISYELLHFDYFQKNCVQEAKSVAYFARLLKVPIYEQDTYIDFYRWSCSKILKNTDSTEGSDESEIRSLNLECRNLIFISVAASIVSSEGGGTIYVGFHKEPDNIMPDCSPGFLAAVNSYIQSSTYNPINVRAPFLELGYDKGDILSEYFTDINLDLLDKVHYCHEEATCGKCDKCIQIMSHLQLSNSNSLF